MEHSHRGHVRSGADLQDPSGQIGIFQIHEKPRIEPTESSQQRASQPHETSARVLDAENHLVVVLLPHLVSRHPRHGQALPPARRKSSPEEIVQRWILLAEKLALVVGSGYRGRYQPDVLMARRKSKSFRKRI